MMKSAIKHNLSGSNKESALSELQKQKEKIFREMKELEYRKQREQGLKKNKCVPAPMPVHEKSQRDKTPPPVIKKRPRIEHKSFEEAMKEAELRNKQNSVNLLEKRSHSESVNLSSMSIKKTTNTRIIDKQPDVPMKKQRLNDYPAEKSKPMILKPINSVKKPEPINSKSSSISRNNSNTMTSSNKSNNFSQSQNRGIEKNATQGSSKSLKNGILAQSNSGISSQNSMKNGIASQSSSRVSGQFSAPAAKTGILAQSNSRQPIPQSSTKSMKNGIVSQSSARTANHVPNYSAGKSVNKNNISNQNPSKNSSRAPADTSISSSQHSSSRYPNDSHSQSRNNLKPTPNRNNNNGKLGHSTYSPPKKPQNIPPATARGIAAQNAVPNRKPVTNYPPKSAYSNNPPARGIAAQNGGRGIMAQSGTGRPPADFISGSEDEDEYDSDLGSFIDDSERDLTDQMKSEIYKSLNHDPSKYSKVSKYDDCKNMESKFNEICKEEMRSLRIGRAEDNQELAEEEKRLKKKGKFV